MLQPIVHTAMRFRAMGHMVTPEQKVVQPGVSFLLRFRLVKVIERFMHLFHSPKRPLHLAFRAGGSMARRLTPRQMRAEFHVEVAQHLLEHAAAGNRPIIGVMCPSALCGAAALSAWESSPISVHGAHNGTSS